MRNAIAAVVLSGVFAVGCSDKSTPGTPTNSTLNLTGTWVGNVTVLGTTTRMTWTLAQTNANVTGPVLLALPTGTVLLNGFLTGTLSGSALTYTISVGPGGIPAQPTCSGQIGGVMTATTGSTSTMTGTSTVTSSNCTPPFPGGTITLTRQ